MLSQAYLFLKDNIQMVNKRQLFNNYISYKSSRTCEIRNDRIKWKTQDEIYKNIYDDRIKIDKQNITGKKKKKKKHQKTKYND